MAKILLAQIVLVLSNGARDAARIGDEFFDGTTHTGLSDSQPCHCPVGYAAEYDEPVDLPFARTIGIASRLAPRLHGTARDKLQVQAASVDALPGSLSKRNLHFFKELLPLRLGQTNDQPSEARQ
jgi:hypothetical protein